MRGAPYVSGRKKHTETIRTNENTEKRQETPLRRNTTSQTNSFLYVSGGGNYFHRREAFCLCESLVRQAVSWSLKGAGGRGISCPKTQTTIQGGRKTDAHQSQGSTKKASQDHWKWNVFDTLVVATQVIDLLGSRLPLPATRAADW